MAEEKDYYKILGVEKNASADEIKRAYKKVAIKYHPDRNPGDKEAEEKSSRQRKPTMYYATPTNVHATISLVQLALIAQMVLADLAVPVWISTISSRILAIFSATWDSAVSVVDVGEAAVLARPQFHGGDLRMKVKLNLQEIAPLA